jgi:mannose-6-phosphate isomerase-like protein (cupin superfamily)
MKSILLSLLIVGFGWSAGDPAGFHYWSASELKGFSQSLGPKAVGGTPAIQQLINFGNYSFMMAMRKGTGQSELHETQADIMMVESGEATLLYGGEMVGGKTSGPNEVRGTGISGGLERKVAAGDIITIPVKTPHMMKIDPGKEILYMTIKVTQ